MDFYKGIFYQAPRIYFKYQIICGISSPNILAMKVSGNSLRPGNAIFHQGHIWIICKAQHTQPGKGGAYMCVVMRNIKDGTKKDERFRASEDVEKLFIEEIEYSFLYKEGQVYVFMHLETYDQISLPEDVFNTPPVFLKSEMKVKIGFHEGRPIFANLPANVVLEVVEADPVVKGQTAASSYKPAKLSNGVKTSVPPYIESGTLIVVNTEDGSYVERYKETAQKF